VGTIGVITPISGHFCGECNRIRVTASGMARGCLFANAETDLKPSLRGTDPSELGKILLRIVGTKPDRHRLCSDDPGKGPLGMSRVGG
jgi:cyclic pyranopterin phosphate synthase